MNYFQQIGANKYLATNRHSQKKSANPHQYPFLPSCRSISRIRLNGSKGIRKRHIRRLTMDPVYKEKNNTVKCREHAAV